ncbi:MAG: 5'-methylthioadenosine/S-adenosylhomocysteine nucleosidase [Prevotella sp.]|nr:5'-methylthioadenosine/S-adenosylhomocysteine nucleosidase [Prevotella sp.]
MKIGIIVAMEKELQCLTDTFAQDPRYIIRQCGIGKVNAAIGTCELINEHHPDAIISTGCAGGVGNNLNIRDIVVSTELCYHDVWCGMAEAEGSKLGQVQGMPPRFKADPKLLDAASQLKITNCKLETGLIVTGDWFVDSKQKMADIVSHFPDARAVDMESCAIAQTCYKYGVPFISFRVISDLPLKDTNASQYHDFWAQVAEQSFHTTRAYVEKIINHNL